MIRGIVGSALLAGGLLALDARLGERAANEAEVVPLVPEEKRSSLPVAAISISPSGSSQELLYVRSRGVWRSREAFGAACQGASVAAFLDAVAGAVGMVRDGADPAELGLGAGAGLLVRLHGPAALKREDRDVLVVVELGASNGAGQAFARLAHTSTVYEIDRDPRRLLGRPFETELPPLLDRRVLAGTFQETRSGYRRIFVDWRDGASLEIARRDVPEEGREEGAPGWEWHLDDETVPPYRAAGYTIFLTRLAYEGLLSPKKRAELGLDDPFCVLTIVPAEGEPAALHVSEPADGRAFVYNGKTGVLCVVRAENVELMLPDRAMFLDMERENPWEAWLR